MRLVEEESDEEAEELDESGPDSYGSLDGGSPREFSPDEDDKLKGKEEDDEGDRYDDNDPSPPRSPNLDIKSAKTVRVSRMVIY